MESLNLEVNLNQTAIFDTVPYSQRRNVTITLKSGRFDELEEKELQALKDVKIYGNIFTEIGEHVQILEFKNVVWSEALSNEVAKCANYEFSETLMTLYYMQAQ